MKKEAGRTPLYELKCPMWDSKSGTRIEETMWVAWPHEAIDHMVRGNARACCAVDGSGATDLDKLTLEWARKGDVNVD